MFLIESFNHFVGKTTYCRGMCEFMNELGRNCALVNLDFANDNTPYTADVDVRELISLEVWKNSFLIPCGAV